MLKIRLKPTGRQISISLPEELADRELEVVIYPLRKKKAGQIGRIKDLLKSRPQSIFSSVTDPVTYQRMLRKEWERSF